MTWDILRNWRNYAMAMLPCKFAALFYVPFMLKWGDRHYHSVFGNENHLGVNTGGAWASYWEYAIRNSCRNLFTKPKPAYRTWPADIKDATLEKLDGFQWRWRVSQWNPAFASFRCTWGKPHKKGKKEFYVGWTMREFDGSKPETTMGFTFFQLRMRSEWIYIAVAIALWILL